MSCYKETTPGQPATFPLNLELEFGILLIKLGKEYLWCTCNKSKTQPFCDNSHKGSQFTPIKVTGSDKNQFLCWCKQTNNPPFCDGSLYSMDW